MLSRSALKMAGQHSADSSEWYTPPEILDPARALLGGIDLDPASSELANRAVCSNKIYTEADDGLSKPWVRFDGRVDEECNVFMNPPTPPREWWKKLILERSFGRLRAVYVAYSLEQLQQSQGWTPGASMLSFPVCIMAKRVRYRCRAVDAISKIEKLIAKRREKPTRCEACGVLYSEQEADGTCFDDYELGSGATAKHEWSEPGQATKAELRRLEEFRALPADELVAGDAPPHASALVGVGISPFEFRRHFDALGDCT